MNNVEWSQFGDFVHAVATNPKNVRALERIVEKYQPGVEMRAAVREVTSFVSARACLELDDLWRVLITQDSDILATAGEILKYRVQG